jgi:hypothetical protein
MANLNIRGIDSSLMAELKAEAALVGKTLRVYVLDLLKTSDERIKVLPDALNEIIKQRASQMTPNQLAKWKRAQSRDVRKAAGAVA